MRALDNHFEGLILFTLAVVVVTLSGGLDLRSPSACAWTYLAARILYVPAYAFGLGPLALGDLGGGLRRHHAHDPRGPAGEPRAPPPAGLLHPA